MIEFWNDLLYDKETFLGTVFMFAMLAWGFWMISMIWKDDP